MKAGFKTTEFWMTVAASLVGMVLASGVVDVTSGFGQIVGLAATTLATLGYTWSRTKIKAPAMPDPVAPQAPPAP